MGRRTQPSSIHLNSQPYHSDTRWFRPRGLYLSCMTCIFKKFIDLCDQTTGNKKNLGLFKIDRAVVDSNRSVNLPFYIRKILCTYPRKRKDIRVVQMFEIGDPSSFLAGGVTCIRRGDLFVSWSGCREDQTS